MEYLESVTEHELQNRSARTPLEPQEVDSKHLYAGLSEGCGEMLQGWLRLEAARRGLKEKNIRKVLRLDKSQYRKLTRGGNRARGLSAWVFACVAMWLEIPIVAALAAAGLADIDHRRAEFNRGKLIDLGLDRISLDPFWGQQLPAEIYMADQSFREVIVRMYQEIIGEQLVPKATDWDLIIDEIKRILP